jgi:hypothetical protein
MLAALLLKQLNSQSLGGVVGLLLLLLWLLWLLLLLVMQRV